VHVEPPQDPPIVLQVDLLSVKVPIAGGMPAMVPVMVPLLWMVPSLVRVPLLL